MSEPSPVHAVHTYMSLHTYCGLNNWINEIQAFDVVGGDAKTEVLEFQRDVVTNFLKNKYRCSGCAEKISELIGSRS